MSANVQIGAKIDTSIKTKTLQKDDQGYYKVILGAVNTYNSAGEYYGDHYVEDLFSPNTYIGHMLAKGALMGEVNHPQFVPGMSNFDFFMRNNRIDQLNASHLIKNIEIVDSGKMEGGRPKKFIVGWVKPLESTKGGKILKELLDTPEANVCFSIRCVIDPSSSKNDMKIKTVITFDWVDLPGIAEANKFDTLANIKQERFVNNIVNTLWEKTSISQQELHNQMLTYKKASGESDESIEHIKKLAKEKQFSVLSRW